MLPCIRYRNTKKSNEKSASERERYQEAGLQLIQLISKMKELGGYRSNQEEFDSRGSPEAEEEKAAWEQIEARSAYDCYKIIYQMKEPFRRKLMLQWVLKICQEPDEAQHFPGSREQSLLQKELILRLPLRQMLDYFTKLFLLNVMEIAILQCYLAKLHWHSLQLFLKEKCGAIGSALQLSKQSQSPEFQAMCLFLFLICRTVKQSCCYTDHSKELEAINEELQKKFEQYFDTKELQRELMGLMPHSQKQPSLKEINEWFKKLNAPYNKSYQDVVEKLLQLATPYEAKISESEANQTEVVEIPKPASKARKPRKKK